MPESNFRNWKFPVLEKGVILRLGTGMVQKRGLAEIWKGAALRFWIPFFKRRGWATRHGISELRERARFRISISGQITFELWFFQKINQREVEWQTCHFSSVRLSANNQAKSQW